MLQALKGKGLFIFSDPGGAKPLLSMICQHKHTLEEVKIISDRTYNFFNDFGLPVSQPSPDIEDDFLYFKPDFVFTGTSYSSKIELNYISKANEKNIPSFSFIDHWTAIRKRFDNNGTEVFPGHILVIDEHAKQQGIVLGIDESKLIITGNPYYDWLRQWKPVVSKKDFLSSIGVNPNKKILVYAPDPLSNINGIETYGFDELSATNTLVHFFINHHKELKDWIVLVKAHPNQNRELLKKITSIHASFYLLPENIDTNTTIYFADVVMGFFSSFLIEADIMHKPVLRFLNVPIKNDPIAELNIGSIVDDRSLIAALSNTVLWN